MPDSRDKRRFRFSLRTMLELTAACAIAVGWWVSHSEYRRQHDEISLKLQHTEGVLEGYQASYRTDWTSFREIDGAKYEIFVYVNHSMFDPPGSAGRMLVVLISGDVVVDWVLEGEPYGCEAEIDEERRLVFLTRNRSVKSIYEISGEGFKLVTNNN